MSYHRELTRAQQAVNSAVDNLVHTGEVRNLLSSEPHDIWDAYDELAEAWKAFEVLAAQADTEGASSGRPTSIAASKDLSVMTSWRGKVQREVFNAGMFRPHLYATALAGGMTCDDLERKLGAYGHSAPHQSISSAVNWAEKTGWITDSGYTRKTRQGKQAIIFDPTAKLIAKIAEERRVA